MVCAGAPQLCDEAGDFAIRVIAWGTAAAAAAYVAIRSAVSSRIHYPIFQSRKADLRQFDEVVRQIERRCGQQLNKDQRRRLHDEISKQGTRQKKG